MLGELEAMGLTLDDLLAAAGRDVPARAGGITVAEYLPTVAAAYLPRTRRTYNSYWTLTVELVGELALDRVTIEDLMGVAEEAARRAQVRRPGSGGRASRESCVAAMRAVFARALKACLVSPHPALLVDKPRRLPNRRGLSTNNAGFDDTRPALSARAKIARIAATQLSRLARPSLPGRRT